MYCLLNTQLVKKEEARIGVTDLAILRGFGIFDFFRLNKGVPVFMEDHLARFYKAATDIGLEVPIPKDALSDQIFQLLKKNDMPESGIRIVLTGGYSEDSYTPAEPNLIVLHESISFPSKSKYENGVKLITHEYLRDLPHVKTINYMTGIFLQPKVKAAGAYDVLYTNTGNVLELTRSNIFIVKNDQIFTPKENMLAGVTRKNLIQAAKKEFEVIEKAISIDELKEAEEVFLSGTTKRVLGISQIDNHSVGKGKVGKVTERVMELFKKCEEEYISSHSRY